MAASSGPATMYSIVLHHIVYQTLTMHVSSTVLLLHVFDPHDLYDFLPLWLVYNLNVQRLCLATPAAVLYSIQPACALNEDACLSLVISHTSDDNMCYRHSV